jgi:citrate synthase
MNGMADAQPPGSLLASLAGSHADRSDTALLAGFGHPLYPSGDPRSAYLLALLPFDSQRENLIEQVHATTGLHPSLDYSLVAIERALHLPPGAALCCLPWAAPRAGLPMRWSSRLRAS